MTKKALSYLINETTVTRMVMVRIGSAMVGILGLSWSLHGIDMTKISRDKHGLRR